jgi:hypothetical protein
LSGLPRELSTLCSEVSFFSVLGAVFARGPLVEVALALAGALEVDLDLAAGAGMVGSSMNWIRGKPNFLPGKFRSMEWLTVRQSFYL